MADKSKSKKRTARKLIQLNSDADAAAVLAYWIKINSQYKDDPRTLLNTIKQTIVSSGISEKQAKIFEEQARELMPKIRNTFFIDTKSYLVQSVNSEDTGAILEFYEKLESELKVTSITEKAILQAAVLAYFRMLTSQRMLNILINQGDASSSTTSLMTFHRKQISQSQNEFLEGIQILKSFKNPPLKVNVIAENAYVAHNQQNLQNEPSINDRQ